MKRRGGGSSETTQRATHVAEADVADRELSAAARDRAAKKAAMEAGVGGSRPTPPAPLPVGLVVGGIAVFAFINFGVKPTGLFVSLFQTLISTISFAFPNLFKAVAASLM